MDQYSKGLGFASDAASAVVVVVVVVIAKVLL